MTHDISAEVENILERQEGRRASLFRTVLTVTIPALFIFAVILGIIAQVTGAFPVLPLPISLIVAAILFGISLRTTEDRITTRGLLLYILGLSGVITMAMFYLGGVQGPVPMAIILFVLLTGLVADLHVGMWVGGINLFIVTAFSALEYLEVLQPYSLSGIVAQILTVLVLLTCVIIVLVSVNYFLKINRRAFALAQEQADALLEARQEAEAAARAQQEARERESALVRRLEEAVEHYTRFLHRVMNGDHDVRLTLDEFAGGTSVQRALLSLGQSLNETVDNLVSALNRMQEVQRRYVREEWRRYMSDRRKEIGYRQTPEGVEPATVGDDVVMEQAAQRAETVLAEEEVALPILQRGEVVGVISVRREDLTEWSEDDVLVLESIVTQLSQTIENLRLLDTAQQRAVREQVVSEVTGRMRETLDMDSVMQTALQEMGKALDIAEIKLRMRDFEES